MARSRSRSSLGSSGGPSLWLWLGVAGIVVLFDQFTKALVAGSFRGDESHVVTSFFSIVYWRNPGAAWSFLAGADGWQRWFFVGLALGACGFILWLLVNHAGQKLFCFAIAMVMGGAIGNVIDRIWRGEVVDFLLFHWHRSIFPAFNLADSAITLGAICLILDELLRVRRG